MDQHHEGIAFVLRHAFSMGPGRATCQCREALTIRGGQQFSARRAPALALKDFFIAEERSIGTSGRWGGLQAVAG
jgi:hypothetical protein